MTRFTTERVHLAIPRARIWPVFDDAAALARVLPGCESLAEVEPRVYRGIAATRLQFLTVRAEMTARLVDLAPPDHLGLELSGRPLALAGGFNASVSIDLAAAPDGGTDVSYTVDLTTSGRLATFGAPLMRDTLRRQIATLIDNLERELTAGAEADASGPERSLETGP
ncbi:MAG: SRPBCC family protein [Chloroflexi bacterium]|nr:SRPBCC family protein [Chloroflexota bacterium]